MFQIKLLTDTARPPTRGSEHAAGYDLFADENFVLGCRNRACISTGISIAVPAGHYGRIAPRSGLAVKKCVDVCAGVVDADYRGEVKVVLHNNHPSDPLTIGKGDRIAQLVLERISTPEVEVVDELPETVRGDGGFGSTGV